MKPQELRIGNYYNSTKWGIPVLCELSDLAQINYITEGAVLDEGHIAEVFEPIPLTEEWLVKFGFEKIKHIHGYTFHTKAHIDIHEQCTYFKGFIVKHCEYVHQLQNLYFALTGEELIIK